MKPTLYANIAGLLNILWFLSCDPRTESPPSSPVPVETKAAPSVQILAPETNTIGLRTTFRWRLQDSPAREIYRYKVRLDKGQNACDGGKVEDEFDAGTNTCLTVDLSRSRYSNERAEFAIVATDSQGRSFCTRGKSVLIDPQKPSAAGCETNKRPKE
jgi:hypothetical protein